MIYLCTFLFNASCFTLVRALRNRFRATGGPRDLTIVGAVAGGGGGDIKGPSSPRPSSKSTQLPSTCWRLPWVFAGSNMGVDLSGCTEMRTEMRTETRTETRHRFVF